MSRCLCNFIHASLWVSKWEGEWVSESVSQWLSESVITTHAKYFSYCSMTNSLAKIVYNPALLCHPNLQGKKWHLTRDLLQPQVVYTYFIYTGETPFVCFLVWCERDRVWPSSSTPMFMVKSDTRPMQDVTCLPSLLLFLEDRKQDIHTGCGAETKSTFKKEKGKKSGLHFCQPTRGRLTVSPHEKHSALHAVSRSTI